MLVLVLMLMLMLMLYVRVAASAGIARNANARQHRARKHRTDNTRPDDDFGLSEPQDGSMTWAYYGQPLYLWKDDAKLGDVTGDGMGRVWHVAAPQD